VQTCIYKMVQSDKATPRKKRSCTSGYADGLHVQISCGAAVPTADIKHGNACPMCSRGRMRFRPAKKWECKSDKWAVGHTSALKNPNNQEVSLLSMDLRIHLDLISFQRFRDAKN
jgi:hypothetical protein